MDTFAYQLELALERGVAGQTQMVKDNAELIKQVAELTKQNAELTKQNAKQVSKINVYEFLYVDNPGEQQQEAEEELDTEDYQTYLKLFALEPLD